jgi:acetylornithine/succinyldiaminopimelate/putrescine aminotransferase
VARELKVYGWRNWRHGTTFHGQTREVMAARSVAEVLRTAGITRATWNHGGSITANVAEVALAMSKPGTVFWQSSKDRNGPWTELEVES